MNHGSTVHLHARAQMALMNRIKKEAAELSDDSDSAGVSATPISEDLKRWKGTISGPKETPCDGCTFAIDIELTNNYPFEPPKMKFDTTVWHPNVSSRTGAICLNILQKEWSPALTIKTALITVQANTWSKTRTLRPNASPLRCCRTEDSAKALCGQKKPSKTASFEWCVRSTSCSHKHASTGCRARRRRCHVSPRGRSLCARRR